MEMRAQLEKKLAQKEKEKKEDHLRQLAQKAREERAGIHAAPTAKGSYISVTYFIILVIKHCSFHPMLYADECLNKHSLNKQVR